MPHRLPAASYRVLTAGAAVAFIAVFAFRWLSIGAIENDHFVALARAHQILHGDWPVRDFTDPGQPLTYLLSAGAAWLFGATLRTDVIVAVTMLSLAASLTYVLAARASGSLLIAAAAVAVEVALAPRLYNAGKILIPLAAVGLGWRYADSPSIPRLIALAAWTAVAFLWRHDFIVYVAVPTVVLFALCHERPRATKLAALYLGVTLALLLPWFGYVQWAGGITGYIGGAVRFAATEAQRTVTWPNDTRLLFVAIMAIPLIAIALARRPDQRLSFAQVVFTAVMALVANLALLRDVIATRLPDVIALTAVLAAWIAGGMIPARVLRATAALGLIIVVVFVGLRLKSQGFGMPTPGKVARRFATVSAMLQTEAPESIPNRERRPLIRYLSSCTPVTSRVLVSGFAPEIPVLAHRPFAGGVPSWIPGYNTHPRDVERAAAQLSREPVSMAVMLEGSAAFVDEWPRLAEDLRARGFVERTWRLDGSDVVVWIPEELAARAPSSPPQCGQT
jgi:hypothetical protein